MGLDIAGILPYKEITLSDLKGKRIAIDGYIHLYQFINTLPKLTDRLGRPTSYLQGIFQRTTHMLALGIKPVFVFDGPFLELKKHERFVKEIAIPRTSNTITAEMINETKQLLIALGVPVVQAPGEGEAQAAHMCAKGDVYAVGSQDYDSLMFGAKRMIKNLSFAKKRKTKKGFVYTGVYQYELKDVLNELKMDYNQFVMFCMLVGTDFNPGIDGFGQKNALKAVQKYKTFTRIFEKVKWQYGYLPKAVYEHIKTMPVTNKYHLKWAPVDVDEVKRILVQEHDFNEKRVMDSLEEI